MATDNVHNYYETQLKGMLGSEPRLAGKNQDYIEDVICLTLNQLPAFYVRFDVDTAAYMSEDKILRVKERLSSALNEAIKQVDAYPHTGE